MNRLFLLSATVGGFFLGVNGYDAIQSPFFEKYQQWVDQYNIKFRGNDHFRDMFDKWQENHKHIEITNAKNLTSTTSSTTHSSHYKNPYPYKKN